MEEQARLEMLDEGAVLTHSPAGQTTRERGGLDWTKKHRSLQAEAQVNEVKIAERLAKLVADEEASNVQVCYDPDDGQPLYQPAPRRNYCACHRGCPGWYGSQGHGCQCGGSL